MSAIDMEARYSNKGCPGVAYWIDGYPQRWEPAIFYAVDDDGEEYEVQEPGEGEWVDDLDSGNVLAVMVGDDYRHTIAIEDLSKIDDLDYCAECGQIGCQHDGRDRS